MPSLLSVQSPALNFISFLINCAVGTLTRGPRDIKIKRCSAECSTVYTEHLVQNRLKRVTAGSKRVAVILVHDTRLVKRRNLS